MERISRMCRSGLCLLLALCMVVGMCPVFTFATEGGDTQEPIKYVSLGDSMSNGYGLDGYDAEAGVYDYGYDCYANNFAEYLATENGWDGDASTYSQYVEHAQLSMSATRPEDINFLLRLNYENPAVVALLDKYPVDDRVYDGCGQHSGIPAGDASIVYCEGCKWNFVDLPGYDEVPVDRRPSWWNLVHGDNWADLIGVGDFWTWKELVEDYRFGTAATYIKYNYGTDAEKAKAAELMANRPAKPRDEGSNGEETCYVAAHYQKMVADADVVSIGIGNGNFGVWLMGRITTALMDADGIGYNTVYDVDEVLATCSPEFQQMINEMLVELDPQIEEYIVDMMGGASEAERASIKDVCTYAVVSFMVNYRGMIERIVELNPDVEIVMLGLMNTYAGDDALAEEGTVTIGNILDILFPPLNTFIAGLPVWLQNVDENAENFADTTFYYAEEYTIECLIQNFGDEDFYNWVGVARDRFVTGLVGECDHGGDPCTDAESCWDWDDGLFWSMLDGYKLGGVTIQRITKKDIADYYKLSDVDRAAFAYTNKDKAASIALYLAIEDAVCKSGRMAPVTLSTLTELSLDDPSLLAKALGNFNAEQEKVIDNYKPAAMEGLRKAGLSDSDITLTDINDMSMVLSLPEAMSNALWSDPDLCSMLAVVARNKLGNGLGAHPSVNGHAALSNKIIAAYEEGYTAADKTDENIPVYAEQFYNFLKNDTEHTDSQKVDLLEKVYAIANEQGMLEDYPEVAVVMDIHRYLDGNDYITDTQTLGIVLFVYERLLDGELSDTDTEETTAYIMELLFSLDEDVQAEVIEGVYYILKGHGYLEDMCDNHVGECEDTAVVDHKCDYGCGKKIGVCEDTDLDHLCDHGCGKVYGKHEDTNTDHKCDYGCAETFGKHEDTNTNHKCDYGCAETFGKHEDADKDHKCDYCKAEMSKHEDTNKDHKCDNGCAEAIGKHEDADKDHKCEYCQAEMGEHKDADKDHKCDYGCNVAMGKHEDKNLDHVCDYNCKEAIGEHKDADNNHYCDHGAEELTKCGEGEKKDHKCDVCGKELSECADADKNHKCDVCGAELSKCADADKDHKCDYCGAEASKCADANNDGKCDVCGAQLVVEKEQEVTRIGGKVRSETARMIADELKTVLGVQKFDVIVYAAGDAYPDALTGTYLANLEKAPILLYRKAQIQKNLDYIKANLSEDGVVYILGGKGAIPESVEADLMAADIKVERLAGKSRYTTNLEILDKAGVKGGETVLVCTGNGYPDALAASATGMPILLVNSRINKLNDDQLAYLKGLKEKCDFILIGGEGVISTKLATELAGYDKDGKVERIGGKSRYETCQEIAEEFFAEADMAMVAYGREYPDALCGGTLGYALNAPIVLVQDSRVQFVADMLDKADIESGYILGGAGRVKDELAKQIFAMDKDDAITVR